MKESEQPDAGDIDPQFLRKLLPDAHELFQFRPKSLDEAFPTAVFVLDTSALVVPYGVGKTGLDEIEKHYKELIQSKRVVVPAHVAREFSRQRAEQIKNIFSALSRARSQSVNPAPVYPVLARMDEYRDIADADKQVAESLAKRSDALGRLVESVRGWRWNDPVSEIYRGLFTKDIVLESDQDEKASSDDAKWRLASRIPPGYADSGKHANAAGDVLVWHTILTVGRTRQKSDVVLVSGDVKSDWFYRSEGIPLYPRFELTDEYRRASSGGSFHIVTLTEFLKRLKAPDAVVNEVEAQEVVLFQSKRPKHHWGFTAEQAVYRWLMDNGYSVYGEHQRVWDFVAQHNGERVGVAVRLVTSNPLWSKKLADVMQHSNSWPDFHGSVLVFFVALRREQAQTALSSGLRDSGFADLRGRAIRVRVGFIGDHGELKLLS